MYAIRSYYGTTLAELLISAAVKMRPFSTFHCRAAKKSGVTPLATVGAPLAPAIAAEKERIFIDCGQLAKTVKALADGHDYLIVEGAGGLMAPLNGGILMADFAKNINLPLLTVCRPNLGTINHTLLTIFAARVITSYSIHYTKLYENRNLGKVCYPKRFSTLA